jgi:hypothetical protein
MRSFEYQGNIYRSLKECCLKRKISYGKLRRLLRHYVKLQNNPALAVEWIETNHPLCLEMKTHNYIHDNELAAIRRYRFWDKIESDLLSRF